MRVANGPTAICSPVPPWVYFSEAESLQAKRLAPFKSGLLRRR